MSTTKRNGSAARCNCGALVPVTADASLCDSDGFRTSEPTHALVNCRSAAHAVPQTLMVALFAEAS